MQSVHVESLPVGDGRETRGERVFSRGFLTLYSPPAMGVGKGNMSYGTEASCPGAVFEAML